MAFLASTVSPPSCSTPNFPINLLNHTPCRPQSLCLLPVRRQPFSSICAKASSMAQFGESSNENNQNLKFRITQVKERIREAIQEPVKELPWKKATDIAMEQLVLLGQKAFKWCFITLGLVSFIGDIVFSISRNCELIIPFGLFVGCLMTDILKEALQQVIPSSEENGVDKHYLEKCFLAISCLFAAVKFVSAGLPMQARIFLLHVANGGFMQVLWLWRGLLHKTDKKDVENSDASLPMDAKS